MKWWLISDEVVKILENALANREIHTCDAFHPGPEGCKGCEQRKRVLHELDSGLNETDVIPKDFQESL